MEPEDNTPSLNSLAFIAAFDKYIYTKKDLETVLKHFIGKSDEETINKIRFFSEIRNKELYELEWRNKFLKKSEELGKYSELVLNTKFFLFDGELHADVDFEDLGYDIEFSYCSHGMNITIICYEDDEKEGYKYILHGPTEKYEIVYDDSEENEDLPKPLHPPLNEKILEYAIFLRTEYEKIEGHVNYSALGDLSDENDTQSDDTHSEENEIEG